MQVVEHRLGRPLPAELAERYQRQSLREIARDLGVSHSTVRTWLGAFGVEPRFVGQRPPTPEKNDGPGSDSLPDESNAAEAEGE